MAKYTMELREVYDKYNEEMVTILANYPIWSENYRAELNKKIIDSLYFREIAFETPEMFMLKLANWLDLSMPYYNQLYKANEAVLELSPTQRVKIIELMESDDVRNRNESSIGSDDSSRELNTDTSTNTLTDRDSTNTSEENYNEVRNENSSSKDKSKDNSTSEGKSYHSDFPQSTLETNYNEDGELEGGLGVGNSAYYTYGDENKNINKNESESESDGSVNSTQDGGRSNKNIGTDKTVSTGSSDTTSKEKNNKKYEENRNSIENAQNIRKSEKVGNTNLTDFELIEMYRKAFVSVDKRLINALKKDLFLQIW